MQPYRSILVPTDFSDNALTAAEFAFDLAQRLKSTVILFHVLHIPVSQIQEDAMVIIERQNEKRADSYNSLNAISEVLKKRFPSVEVKTEVRSGFLADSVKEVVEDFSVELVVMGTKGASGIKELLVGSNTSHVLDEVSVPVFAIPNEIVQKPFNRILFATDFEFDDVDALEDIARLAEAYDAEIKVVHITDETTLLNGNDDGRIDWLKEICEQRIKYDRIKFQLISRKENNLESINKIVKEYNADMVCMSSSGKGLFKRLFNGSLTHKMVYHSGIPFMAYHVKAVNKI
jgi:nucleotide-binding universal stress UspA family protein